MQVTIDVSGWTQEQKNYLQAAAVALLFQAGITYGNISAKDNVLNIENPSADVFPVLNPVSLKEYIVAEQAKSEVARLAALPEIQARELEIATSQFTDIKLAKVDAAIDAVSNLAELKVLLKKFARYVIARS